MGWILTERKTQLEKSHSPLQKTQNSTFWGLLIANPKIVFCDLLTEETSCFKNFHQGMIWPSVPSRLAYPAVHVCRHWHHGVLLFIYCHTDKRATLGIWADLEYSLFADTGNLCIFYKEYEQCYCRGLINWNCLPECIFTRQGFKRCNLLKKKC